jgi:hypothetical protein
MKIRKLNSTNNRKKHLRQQHQKVNARRLHFFSQVNTNTPETT